MDEDRLLAEISDAISEDNVSNFRPSYQSSRSTMPVLHQHLTRNDVSMSDVYADDLRQPSQPNPRQFLDEPLIERISTANQAYGSHMRHLPPPLCNTSIALPWNEREDSRFRPASTYQDYSHGAAPFVPDRYNDASYAYMKSPQVRRMLRPTQQEEAYDDPMDMISSYSEDQDQDRASPSPITRNHGQCPPNLQSRRPQQTAAPDANAMAQMKTHGIKLVSTEIMPDAYRRLFNFKLFNAVQSKVFPSVFESDENLVVASPTGSGKTVIFELAILRMIQSAPPRRGEDNAAGRNLAVYMAPTKSLCSERALDWQQKFQGIGLHVAEFTGDMGNMKEFLKEAKRADIMVTTPEKWDSVTRRGSQNQKSIGRLGLLMIDEVHILHDKRGAVLEAVVARMKTSVAECPVRVIALSATVPNVEDVARWLRPATSLTDGVFEAGGSSAIGQTSGVSGALHMPMAKVFKFGEDFRPTKLERFVHGFNCSGWAFNGLVQKELYALLQQYASNKPCLVFGSTRKFCLQIAQAVHVEYQKTRASGSPLPWQPHYGPPLDLEDEKLQDIAKSGIAIHHAGLSMADRRSIENAFKDGRLMMIASTSTLSVGVNLPAHTVVLAGTQSWNGSALVEYADIEVQQMFGRAGRPQFDDSGTAVVMCEKSQVQKYRDLMGSNTVLESCLHENLIEHINAEIVLKTITSVESGKQWIRSTFLYVRIMQKPGHYAKAINAGSAMDAGRLHWQCALDKYVEDAIKSLSEQSLVRQSSTGEDRDETAMISSTSLGEIMSNCCLSFATMSALLAVPANANVRLLLEHMSSAAEFESIRFRGSEKALYNKINQSADIRYPLAKKPGPHSDKVFLLIQICLGNVAIEDYKGDLKVENANPMNELFAVFNNAVRVAKAMVAIALEKKDGGTAKAALELLRCIHGKSWENTSTVFRQITNIGAKSIRVLAMNGIRNFQDLSRADSRRLEMLLNRNSTFVRGVIDHAKAFPRFNITIEQESVDPPNEEGVVFVSLAIGIGCDGELLEKDRRARGIESRFISFLALLNDGEYVSYHRIKAAQFAAERSRFKLRVAFKTSMQKVQVVVGVDQLAGCSTFIEFKPDIPAEMLPMPVDTRPTEADAIDVGDESKAKDGTTITLEVPTQQLVEPVRLSNGNWRCNHRCRPPCKHSCCALGVKKKPRLASPAPAEIGPMSVAASFVPVDRGTETPEDLQQSVNGKVVKSDTGRDRPKRKKAKRTRVATADAFVLENLDMEDDDSMDEQLDRLPFPHGRMAQNLGEEFADQEMDMLLSELPDTAVDPVELELLTPPAPRKRLQSSSPASPSDRKRSRITLYTNRQGAAHAAPPPSKHQPLRPEPVIRRSNPEAQPRIAEQEDMDTEHESWFTAQQSVGQSSDEAKEKESLFLFTPSPPPKQQRAPRALTGPPKPDIEISDPGARHEQLHDNDVDGETEETDFDQLLDNLIDEYMVPEDRLLVMVDRAKKSDSISSALTASKASNPESVRLIPHEKERYDDEMNEPEAIEALRSNGLLDDLSPMRGADSGFEIERCQARNRAPSKQAKVQVAHSTASETQVALRAEPQDMAEEQMTVANRGGKVRHLPESVTMKDREKYGDVSAPIPDNSPNILAPSVHVSSFNIEQSDDEAPSAQRDAQQPMEEVPIKMINEETDLADLDDMDDMRAWLGDSIQVVDD